MAVFFSYASHSFFSFLCNFLIAYLWSSAKKLMVSYGVHFEVLSSLPLLFILIPMDYSVQGFAFFNFLAAACCLARFAKKRSRFSFLLVGSLSSRKA